MRRKTIIATAILILMTIVASAEPPARAGEIDGGGSPSLMAPAFVPPAKETPHSFVLGKRNKGQIRPLNQEPISKALYRFEDADEVPCRGHLVTPQNDEVSRSNHAVGPVFKYLYGGGFTEDGKRKMRERWVFRFEHLDPETGQLTTLFTYQMEYRYRMLNSQYGFYSHNCWNGYPCYLGYSGPDYLESLYPYIRLGCARKLGPGYSVNVDYEYSTREEPREPYDVHGWDADDPPVEMFTGAWGITPTVDAIRVGVKNPRIRPSIPFRNISVQDHTITNVGGAKTTKIDPGQTRIWVRTAECGTSLAGVAFSGEVEHLPSSGGHIHETSNAKTPPSGKVSNVPPSFAGVTDSGGYWESDLITAGEFAGVYEITAKTSDLGLSSSQPTPMEAKPSGLTVGFSDLFHISNIPSDGIVLVGHNNSAGCGSDQCNNHKDMTHFGHPWLLTFIEAMVYEYQKKYPGAVLPINDMSLPFGGAFEIDGSWSTAPKVSHVSHRHGVDVDVNKKAVTINGVTYPAVDASVLNKIVEQKLQGKKIPEGPLHYRLPADWIDALAGGL